MASTGTVYIKIRLRLNQDIELEKLDELVQELDYHITDEAGLISDTEIVDYSTNNA